VFKNRLAVIIPTKERLFELGRLLTSLDVQSYKPEQVIIVDASAVANGQLTEEYKDLDITYIHKDTGITEARNVGIASLKKDINLVCFLDDDVVIESNAVEEMMSFWETADESVGGCSFFIANEIRQVPFIRRAIRAFFCAGSKRYGKILRSGVNISPYNPAMKSVRTDWLSGGVTIWKREVFDNYLFDEWFSGYGMYEDVDFSYRVSKHHKLFVNADAKVRHLSDSSKSGRNYLIGKKEVINRLYFVKKNPELSVLLSLWAGIGELLNNLFKGFFLLKKELIIRSCGNIVGIFSYIILKDKVFERN